MKIIQIFWGKPLMERIGNRTNTGWPEKKYCYMSQALSCLQLTKYYPDVELITDTVGKRLLLEEMELPYSTVRTDLDLLPDYPGELWSAKNLYAYSTQEKPFIHVDGDVFITGRLDEGVEKADLLCMNKYNIYSKFLQDAINHIVLRLTHKPDYLNGLLTDKFNIYNPGIFGGNDIPFISCLAIECLKTIDSNIRFINHMLQLGMDDHKHEKVGIIDVINMIFQSYMFTSSALKHSKKTIKIYDAIQLMTVQDSETIAASPENSHIHPFYNKRKRTIYRQLEYQLQRLHPGQYYRISKLIKEFRI